jgi:hypothetical protein
MMQGNSCPESVQNLQQTKSNGDNKIGLRKSDNLDDCFSHEKSAASAIELLQEIMPNQDIIEDTDTRASRETPVIQNDGTFVGENPDALLVEDADSSVGLEKFDEEPKSIIIALLKQLRLNADLHKVTLPTFILEPRSLLERITDFMAYPHLILHAPLYECAEERFKSVLKYFFSAWHIRPKGVKKPYNPILGEFFRCQWRVPPPSTSLQVLEEDLIQPCTQSQNSHKTDIPYCEACADAKTTTSYYVAEQVCHHPPVSAFFYANPDHHVVIQGNFRPGSKFLGNSAVSFMGGHTCIYFTNRPGEEYTLTNPNYYIRGTIDRLL